MSDENTNWTNRDDYRPGSMGCHEALHTVALIENLIDVELVHHAAIALNPEWMKLVLTAQEALQQLYQKIGNEHLSA